MISFEIKLWNLEEQKLNKQTFWLYPVVSEERPEIEWHALKGNKEGQLTQVVIRQNMEYVFINKDDIFLSSTILTPREEIVALFNLYMKEMHLTLKKAS